MVDGPVVSGNAPLTGARRRLVEELRAKGIADAAVLRAIELTPRHLFVPSGVRHRAYEDAPLPIGNAQTISQPFVHARSLELLAIQPDDRVLEVGTGSGYQTALLTHLAKEVFSVERLAPLLTQAEAVVRTAGALNVEFACRDGTGGWPERAPFNAIVVSAGAPEVPQPLIDQLVDGGRLLTPVGGRDNQHLVLVVRRGERSTRQVYDPVRFVPLVGSHGWDA